MPKISLNSSTSSSSSSLSRNNKTRNIEETDISKDAMRKIVKEIGKREKIARSQQKIKK